MERLKFRDSQRPSFLVLCLDPILSALALVYSWTINSAVLTDLQLEMYIKWYARMFEMGVRLWTSLYKGIQASASINATLQRNTCPLCGLFRECCKNADRRTIWNSFHHLNHASSRIGDIQSFRITIFRLISGLLGPSWHWNDDANMGFLCGKKA